MFNPFAPFTEKALGGMIAAGHRYFVRQCFPRGRDHFEEGIRACFLLCHYKDYAPAKEHLDAICNDRYRFLYDWEDPTHQGKLLTAAAGVDGYKIFTNTFLPDWERQVTPRIHQKIAAYLRQQGWKLDRNETVTTYFYPHFGEVMIGIKFRRRELRVKFEEIEKIFL